MGLKEELLKQKEIENKKVDFSDIKTSKGAEAKVKANISNGSNLMSQEEINTQLDIEVQEITEKCVQPIVELFNILDEEIEKIKESEAIQEIQSENSEEQEEIKTLNLVKESTKASLEIVTLGREVLKNDIDYVNKYAKISEQNVKVMNENYELNAKMDKLNLSYKGFWFALGIVSTLLFPEVLPYLEEGYKWYKELKGN